MSEHERTTTGDRVCPATEGPHECDLAPGHYRSRHVCVCGRFFGEPLPVPTPPKPPEPPPVVLHEDHKVYVCTREPYHENSTLVGVTDSLVSARVLLGYPDAEDWQDGDPIDTANEAPVWYTMAAGEPLPRIAAVSLLSMFPGRPRQGP
jgi:hypothetical protein